MQAGSKVYILNRESVPYMCVGTVVSVSQPRANPSNWQQMIVTLVAKVDGTDRTFENLPSDKDMADSMTGMQIFCDREMAVAEVKRTHNASSQIVADIDKHRAIVKACDGILRDLCPEIAEKAAREQEIEAMKAQLAEMRDMFMKVMGDAKTRKEEQK